MMGWIAVSTGTTTTGILIGVVQGWPNRYVAFRQFIKERGLIDAVSPLT